MIKRVELEDGYSVIVENDTDTQKSTMGVNSWDLMFVKKQDVMDHIKLLEKALEFWEYD